MSLKQQFQVFLGSIVLGMLFLCIWSLFNACFYRLKRNLLRLPLETLLFCGLAFIYYRFLVIITSGVLNIFYPLALFLGALIYQKFYSPYINRYINIKIQKLEKKLKTMGNKIILFYNKHKLKVRRKKKNEIKKSA